jgi:phage/plasmid-associated DNA primase
MFQFPAVKTTALTFISNEGAGKGTLLHLLNLMMGDKKVFETTKPSRDVWGSFNNLMSSSFLVNLNEMALKEATDAEGYIKGLITDDAMTINTKGVSAYTIKSFHRFIITTNNADPIKVKKNDRRNVVIQSSDELIGNAKYFIDINKTFENVNARRSIYDYLMSIEGLENFKTDIRPVTEYQKDMCEITRDNYDRWVENIALTTDEEELKLTGVEQYRLFSEWVSKNGIKFECNVIKMCLGIKRMNLAGIECGLRTKEFRYTKYNITALKKHYGIGCLLL